MHWCAYPSPTHSLIQAKKQQNKISKHNTIFNHVLENSRCDWQSIKMATGKMGSKSAFIIVPPPKCKRFTDTSTDGHQWVKEKLACHSLTFHRNHCKIQQLKRTSPSLAN